MCTELHGLYYDINSRSYIWLRTDATYDDQVSKFIPFEINDDESLQVMLETTSKNTTINSLDLYIEIENIPDAYQTIDVWIGPYATLLTQEVESLNPSL